MKKIVNKTNSFKEAEEWDIQQQIQMTLEQRQEVAIVLRKKVYGTDAPDVRESSQNK